MTSQDGMPDFDQAGYEETLRKARERQRTLEGDPWLKDVNEWTLKNVNDPRPRQREDAVSWARSLVACTNSEMRGEAAD